MNPYRKTFGIWVPDRSLTDNRGFISPGVIGAAAGARRRTGAAFNPENYGTVLVWLKADGVLRDGSNNVISADGAQIKTWEDSSSAGRNFALTTASAKITFQTNEINTSYPVVRYAPDGASTDYLKAASMMTTVRTAFIVCKWRVAVAYADFLGGDASTFDWHGGTPDILISTTFASASVTGGSVWENSSAANYTTLKMKTSGFSVVQAITTGNVSFKQLGQHRTNTARVFDGDIAEVIVYSDALSTGNREAVRDALNLKYALF